MRLPKTISKLQKGFTLVELLIVIAILGILSTAVLSAINPVEQINRGRDTGTQSDAEQLLSAIQRFNANSGYFPWQEGASDGLLGTGSTCAAPNCNDFTGVRNDADPAAPNFVSYNGGWTVGAAAYAAGTPGAEGSNVLDVLGSGSGGSQELQNAFIDRVSATTYNTLYVYNRGDNGDSTYVCFKPQSNSFRQNAIKRWNQGAICTLSDCDCDGAPADLMAATTEVCLNATDNLDDPDTLYCLP